MPPVASGPRDIAKEIKLFPNLRRIYLDSVDGDSLLDFKRSINELKLADSIVLDSNVEMLESIHPDVAKAYKKNVKAPDIILDISSPGGSAYAGLSMYDVIERYNSNVKNVGGELVAEMSGCVASMGTVIMLACKHRRAHKNTRFMIHSVSSFIGYEKLETAKENIDEMEHIEDIIEQIYFDKTRIGKELMKEIRNCKKNYWIDAEQALKLGLITEII